MDSRNEILNAALAKNAKETQRWETYQKENIQTIKNLKTFSKKLLVDVMVPVGKKAFIPGQLIHTNEVFVAHYQGYFSQTSAHTASEICQRRLRLAEEQLKKLKTENELWQNKLEKPYIDGVVPKPNEHEIIEEYDEVKETIWRQEHRKRLKEWKLREIDERVNDIKSNTPGDTLDINKLLEEAELLEELKSEMEDIQIKNSSEDDILQKLISGEMVISEKKRISHQNTKQEFDNLKSVQEINVLKNDIPFPNVLKKSNLIQNEHPDWTNNNCRQNPDLFQTYNDGNQSDSSVVSDDPEEVELIEKQAEFLAPEDRVGFYKYQLQIINQKILIQSCKNEDDIEGKVHLFKIRDRLEQFLEEESENEINFIKEKVQNDSDVSTNEELITKSELKNHRISFALEDKTIEFNENDKIENMFKKSQSIPVDFHRKDIISLDETIINVKNLKNVKRNHSTILEKVENNFNHFAETQSLFDSIIVSKIIDEKRTLYIHFKHSKQKNTALKENYSPEIYSHPNTPGEIYEMFSKVDRDKLNLNEEGNKDVKVPILKEIDRSEAYEDVRAVYSKPVTLENHNSIDEKKSILRNKSAVERETHKIKDESNGIVNKNKKNKNIRNQPIDEGQYMSAFVKVMSDIVEKSTTHSQPDALPTCKFVDALTPKKRVSRFKKMQNKKTNSNLVNNQPSN